MLACVAKMWAERDPGSVWKSRILETTWCTAVRASLSQSEYNRSGANTVFREHDAPTCMWWLGAASGYMSNEEAECRWAVLQEETPAHTHVAASALPGVMPGLWMGREAGGREQRWVQVRG